MKTILEHLSTMDSYTPSAKDIIGSSPLIAIANEAPAKLIVDPPLLNDNAEGLFPAFGDLGISV
jgi:hypothetical protein